MKTLNKKQITKLASLLINTRINVYSLCQSLFSIGFTDELWAKLEKQEKIFRCEECNFWKGDDVRCSPEIDRCCDCDEVLHGDDDA